MCEESLSTLEELRILLGDSAFSSSGQESLLLEGARQDVSAEDFRENERSEGLSLTYEESKNDIRRMLERGIKEEGIPEIEDWKCKLFFRVGGDGVGGPLFQISLKTKERNHCTEFYADLKEMEDLLHKLKDARSSIHRFLGH